MSRYAHVDLDLAEEPLRGQIVVQILKAMTEEKRTELIADAVKRLLQDAKDGDDWDYHARYHSRLTQIFDRAVQTAAEEIVRSHIAENTELRSAIADLAAAAARRILELKDAKGNEVVVNSLARTLAAALAGD